MKLITLNYTIGCSLFLESQILESNPNGHLQERDVPLRHKTQFTAVIVLAEHGVWIESVMAEESGGNQMLLH